MKQSYIYIYISFLLSLTACQTIKQTFDKTVQPKTNAQPKPEITPEVSAVSRVEVLKVAPVVATIANNEMSVETLKAAIEQLSVGDSVDKNTALGQVVLNQRLLIEAKRLGYDKSEEYIGELQTYRDLLAQSYTTDSSTIKYLLKETYQWMHEEIHAAQIMYQVPEFAEARDTAVIYQKLLDIRQKALAGADFAKLAEIYSQDKKTNLKGGDIGWFTALQLTYPLEKAAYNTPVGQVSMPIRTKGGFHLLKIIDRRPYRGEVQVQHIMKVVYPKSPDSLKIKAKMDSLYLILKNGGNFDELCRKYSDDFKTKENGGILPKFKVGKTEDSFDQAAFSLHEAEVSKPVRTEVGWHILKLIKKYPLESYQKMLPKLQDKMVTDSRGDLVHENTIGNLKVQHKFVENAEIIKAAIAEADTNLFKKKTNTSQKNTFWNYSANDTLLNKTIFTINQQKFQVRGFFDYVRDKGNSNKISTGLTPLMLMRGLYKSYAENTLKTYAEEHLEENNPDFKATMNDYSQDLLTMRLMNERVYDKSLDTLGQRRFYEQNSSKFAMPERAFGTIITANDAKYLEQIKATFAKGTPYQLKRGIQPIFYAKYISALSVEDKKRLMGLLSILKKNPTYIVEVGGHADFNEGDNVSAERLKTVVKFLMANGLPITRIIENDYVKAKRGKEGDKNAQVSFQFFSNTKSDLEKTLNTKTPNAVSISEGPFKHGENKLLDKTPWQVGVQTFQADGKIVEINIQKIEAPRNKTIKEARGEVIKGYQDFLDKQFKQELANKYPVLFNKEELQKMMNEIK